MKPSQKMIRQVFFVTNPEITATSFAKRGGIVDTTPRRVLQETDRLFNTTFSEWGKWKLPPFA